MNRLGTLQGVRGIVEELDLIRMKWGHDLEAVQVLTPKAETLIVQPLDGFVSQLPR